MHEELKCPKCGAVAWSMGAVGPAKLRQVGPRTTEVEGSWRYSCSMGCEGLVEIPRKSRPKLQRKKPKRRGF